MIQGRGIVTLSANCILAGLETILTYRKYVAWRHSTAVSKLRQTATNSLISGSSTLASDEITCEISHESFTPESITTAGWAQIAYRRKQRRAILAISEVTITNVLILDTRITRFQHSKTNVIIVDRVFSQNVINVRKYGVVMCSVASVCVCLSVCPVRALTFARKRSPRSFVFGIWVHLRNI